MNSTYRKLNRILRQSPLHTTVILILSCFCIWLFHNAPNCPKLILSQDDFNTLLEKRLRDGVHRGKYCWKNECFAVIDFFRGLFSHEAPARVIVPEGFDHVILSETVLSMPEVLTYDMLDTSKWHVNKSALTPVSYVFSMISSIFATGAISCDNPKGSVINIGLGGGSINNLLYAEYSEIYQTIIDINPATKQMAIEQFGLMEDERSTVIIADGSQYLIQEAKRGVKIDAILIDACYNKDDHVKGLVCPVDTFLSAETIRAAAELLGSTGVLVYNFLVMDQTGRYKSTIDEVISAHEFYFGHGNCRSVPISFVTNQVLLCRSGGLPPTDEFETTQRKVARKLHLNLDLDMDEVQKHVEEFAVKLGM